MSQSIIVRLVMRCTVDVQFSANQSNFINSTTFKPATGFTQFPIPKVRWKYRAWLGTCRSQTCFPTMLHMDLQGKERVQ